MKKEEKAAASLEYIIPILKKYKFKWCISGHFAFFVYGVKRPFPDEIHIDIEADKDEKRFKNFLVDVGKFTTFLFQYYKDKNYDHYVLEVNVKGFILSICTTKNLKMFDKNGKSKLFYKKDIPKPKMVSFNKLKIPLLPKKWVVKMRESLAVKKPIDIKDISEMKKILKNKEYSK